MGFSFQSAEERNPTPPSHEELQRKKTKHNSDWDKTMTPETTKMVSGMINENTQLHQENYMLKSQLDEVNEFIDENRLLQTFYAWKAIREQMRDTGAEVIE